MKIKTRKLMLTTRKQLRILITEAITQFNSSLPDVYSQSNEDEIKEFVRYFIKEKITKPKSKSKCKRS